MASKEISEIKVWKSTAKSEYTILHSLTADVGSIAFSPNGSTLACGRGDIITFWDVKTGKVSSIIRIPTADANVFAYSPDGILIATGGLDNSIRIVNVKNSI